MPKKEFLVNVTNDLYQTTLLFSKKEPLRYKLRELADEIVAGFISLSHEKNEKEKNKLLKDFEKKIESLSDFLDIAKKKNWVSRKSILKLKNKYREILNPTPYGNIDISILIPCYNEEKSIRKCIESCLKQTKPADEIIVVDDGSTDSTPKILNDFGDKIKVKRIDRNSGNKSYAQEFGLQFVNGDVFITTDADTVLDKNFVKRVSLDFKKDDIVAVAGYVRSIKHNWLTNCRELDYIIGQDIHKVAQSFINALFVIPGCAGVFKTDFFRKNIGFEHDTLTEDLDFTYKLHESGFKIKYDRKVLAYTQDPQDLKSYVRQMRRWYCGGWQNLAKHYKRIFNKSENIFELSLIYVEGVIFSTLLFLIPLININVFKQYILFYFMTLFCCATYASLKRRDDNLLFYFPLYCVIVFINAWIFLESFIKEIILKNKNLVWLKPKRRKI